MKPGVPNTTPAAVSEVPSAARAMPKSITRGPSVASSTLAGLRSRCTTPQAWIACSASTSPASSGHSACSGSGPCSVTSWSREGPGTNAVASHGGRSFSPLATTGAV